MKNLGILYAFLGGAVVGCATAILFAPEKGSDTRCKIAQLLKDKGIKLRGDKLNELVDEITEQVESDAKA